MYWSNWVISCEWWLPTVRCLAGGCCYAGAYSADILFYFDGALQGPVGRRCAGGRCHRQTAGCDRVLISEGCTIIGSATNIGTVKMPGWLQDYTGKQLQFSFTSGTEFPDDLSSYQLVIHCGGCMLNERECVIGKMRCRSEYTVYQLWHCHCLYAGYFETQYWIVSTVVGKAVLSIKNKEIGLGRGVLGRNNSRFWAACFAI